MKQSDIDKFIKQLKKPVDDYKNSIEVSLRESEKLIETESKRMIPYDSGAGYASYFSRIEKGRNSFNLTVGYDESGSLPYLALIHEVAPVPGKYGWFALAPEVDYTDVGFKENRGSPAPSHEPQIKFLENAITHNWATILQKLKVDFK